MFLIADGKRARLELERRRAVGELPARGISWSWHPDDRTTLVVTTARPELDRIGRDLVERYGRRYWFSGAWRTERAQLSLPFCA